MKFYAGDENLIKGLKPQNVGPQIVKADDTRAQVKKIVENLLKSNSKKLGVSQMQNGIKGKNTKSFFLLNSYTRSSLNKATYIFR